MSIVQREADTCLLEIRTPGYAWYSVPLAGCRYQANAGFTPGRAPNGRGRHHGIPDEVCGRPKY
jgi:hypothetical protein